MNKKIGLIFVVALIIVLLGGFLILRFLNKKDENANESNNVVMEEYTPEAEISEEQVRQTIVSLYFPLKENNKLVPEARLIDIKEIINNPYEKLIQLLIEGPKNEKNKSVFPDGVSLNKCYLENDCVFLDFSSEILGSSDKSKKDKENLISSIVNTLTELTEVNGVKFLIDGKDSDEFEGVYTRGSVNV